MTQDKTPHGAIIEFIPLGNSVKVTAVDPATGTEVSIVGAASASDRELSALALRKLAYVLERKTPPEGGSGGGGIVV
ncbi:MAG: serine hydroxymethyltransferase [Rhodothalassiaceae bacterium]